MKNVKQLSKQIDSIIFILKIFISELEKLKSDISVMDDGYVYTWKQRATVSRDILSVREKLNDLNKKLYNK